MNLNATTVKLAGVGVLAFAVLVAVLFVADSCHREPGPKIPVETQATIDSLRFTAEAFRRMADSSQRIVVYDTIRSVVIQRVAAKAVETSARLGTTADSLARLAKDSAALWERAYNVRTMEADTLRLAVAQLDTALAYERNARRTLGMVYGADTLRRITTERVNADLQTAISHLQQPCRVLGPIPCPSRSVTLVLSVTAGAAAGYFLARR